MVPPVFSKNKHKTNLLNRAYEHITHKSVIYHYFRTLICLCFTNKLKTAPNHVYEKMKKSPGCFSKHTQLVKMNTSITTTTTTTTMITMTTTIMNHADYYSYDYL